MNSPLLQTVFHHLGWKLDGAFQNPFLGKQLWEDFGCNQVVHQAHNSQVAVECLASSTKKAIQ